MEIVNCQIRGRASQDLLFWVKSHQMDFHGPGETDEETNDLQTRHCMARYVESCLMHQNVEKSKSGLSRNQSLIMPGDYVEFTMKNARRKLEIPMPAAMPWQNTNKQR